MAIGTAAIGLLGAVLVWGLALGLLVPWFDKLLQRRHFRVLPMKLGRAERGAPLSEKQRAWAGVPRKHQEQ